MLDRPDFAAIAALLGDPTRARMLGLLMGGRAETATELALEGGVTPPTASSHLARLSKMGLLSMAKQGRHRYFRIASPEVAAAIEGLLRIAPGARSHAGHPRPRDEGLRRARVCYDHLAGEAGVLLLDRLRGKGFLEGADEALALTARGEAWCGRIGLDLDTLRARRRRLCRPCLDWSARRMHLAGALGAALLDRLLGLRYARREPGGRALLLTQHGEKFVEHLELAH